MNHGRWVMWVAGMGLVATVALVLANGADSGVSTTPDVVALMSTLAGVSVVTASVWCREMRMPWLVWVLGATWSLPWLSGLWALPAVGATVADAWSWVLLGLVVTTVWSLRTSADSAGKAATVLLTVTGTAVGALSRLFLHDPLLDPDCWLTCRHNPVAIDGASGVAAWADAVALALLGVALGLAVVGATRSRDVLALATLGILIAIGLALDQWGDPGSILGFSLAVTTQVTAVATGLSLLTGEVDSWWVRRRLRQFAVRLASASGEGGVQLALSSALRDPSVGVRYWAEAREGFVDIDGHSVVAPALGPSDVEVTRAGRPLAVIRPSRPIGPARLSAALGPAVRLALENDQLTASLRAELADLEESRSRLLERTREERRRLERNLHDGAQQRVVTVLLSLRVLARGGAPHAVGERAESAAEAATRLLEDLRHVARGIHPAVVADAGLHGALTDLVVGHPDVDVCLAGDAWSAPSASAQTTVYELADEVLGLPDGSTPTTVRMSATPAGATTAVEIRHNADVPLGATALDSIAAQVDALNGRFMRTGGPGDWRLRMELPCES